MYMGLSPLIVFKISIGLLEIRCCISKLFETSDPVDKVLSCKDNFDMDTYLSNFQSAENVVRRCLNVCANVDF